MTATKNLAITDSLCAWPEPATVLKWPSL